MSSFQYRKSHCGDKTVVRPSYQHNGNSYTGKTTYFCWIGPLVFWGPGVAFKPVKVSSTMKYINANFLLLVHLGYVKVIPPRKEASHCRYKGRPSDYTYIHVGIRHQPPTRQIPWFGIWVTPTIWLISYVQIDVISTETLIKNAPIPGWYLVAI